MKVIITGSSGMLGQAVLKESLLDPRIEKILLVQRSPSGEDHAKVEEVILKDFFDVHKISEKLKGYDNCFFCAGISSNAMSEEEYRRITHDMTLKFAEELLKRNPGISFTYISAYGADAISKTMWAKIKGQTENDLIKLGFSHTHIFRPAYTHPDKGLKIKSAWNRRILFFTRPLYLLIKVLFPKHTTTSTTFGKAMVNAAIARDKRTYFEVPQINQLG